VSKPPTHSWNSSKLRAILWQGLDQVEIQTFSCLDLSSHPRHPTPPSNSAARVPSLVFRVLVGPCSRNGQYRRCLVSWATRLPHSDYSFESRDKHSPPDLSWMTTSCKDDNTCQALCDLLFLPSTWHLRDWWDSQVGFQLDDEDYRLFTWIDRYLQRRRSHQS